MKTGIKLFKITVFALSLTLATTIMTSCGSNEPSNKDSEERAHEQNEENFTVVKASDAEFLVNAAIINLKEIQLGQLAKSNSELADVKSLGVMMETEHTNNLKELQLLAEKKHVVLPTSLTGNAQDDYQRMLNTTARDFDKDYTDLMVKGHQEAVELFDKASTGAEDPEVRNWATSVLPDLRIHLDHSLACQQNVQLTQSAVKK